MVRVAIEIFFGEAKVWWDSTTKTQLRERTPRDITWVELSKCFNDKFFPLELWKEELSSRTWTKVP